MATQCNSHQQHSAVFQQLYHGLTPLLYKTFDYFGKDDQTSILNLLPHLQDRTLNTGWIITHTDMHTFLYYTENLNPAHYTFTVTFMWNNANYTDKCHTNIHTQCTANYQLQLKPLCSTFYYHHASLVQHPD